MVLWQYQPPLNPLWRSFVESHNTKLRMAYNMSVTSLNIFEVVIAAVTEAIWAKWTFSNF